jgi:hypothetical protein
MKSFVAQALSPLETLQLECEFQRSHFGEFTVVEEPDRYVITMDPCGSGGRLRRTKDVGVTKKAHPWTWSKSGVPYYCVHCCIMWEILAIELQGYPIKIHIPSDRSEGPCLRLICKRPELTPEEYFTRVGKTKTIK